MVKEKLDPDLKKIIENLTLTPIKNQNPQNLNLFNFIGFIDKDEIGVYFKGMSEEEILESFSKMKEIKDYKYKIHLIWECDGKSSYEIIPISLEVKQEIDEIKNIIIKELKIEKIE